MSTDSPAPSAKAGDRIVWVDCEMTGLDLGSDALVEVACVVTDADLLFALRRGFLLYRLLTNSPATAVVASSKARTLLLPLPSPSSATSW